MSQKHRTKEKHYCDCDSDLAQSSLEFCYSENSKRQKGEAEKERAQLPSPAIGVD